MAITPISSLFLSSAHIASAHMPSAPASRRRSPQRPTRASARGTPTRILVVEDEAAIALDVAGMLRRAGYHVTAVCQDVDSALAAIAASDVDAAVLDLKLGCETSDRVADQLDDRAIPFIWISGADPETLPRRHRERPFLAKPFSHAQFLAAVRAGCAAAA